jgi:hypothetical protein
MYKIISTGWIPPILKVHQGVLASQLRYSVLDSIVQVNRETPDHFAALGSSICQFNRDARFAVYERLKLDRQMREHLENNREDLDRYGDDLATCIRAFVEKEAGSLPFDPVGNLHILADMLDIRLLVIQDQEDGTTLYPYVWENKTLSVGDYECFDSQTCLTIACELGIFEKTDETQVVLTVTTHSHAIRKLLTDVAQYIEQQIKNSFQPAGVPPAPGAYHNVLGMYSKTHYTSSDNAIAAFQHEIAKLGDIIPEIQDAIGYNPLAVIYTPLPEDDNLFCTCDTQQLIQTQEHYLQRQVQQLSKEVFR